MQALKLSELMGALSHALDITEGQPEGHCVRCCWIGKHIGDKLALPPPISFGSCTTPCCSRTWAAFCPTATPLRRS